MQCTIALLLVRMDARIVFYCRIFYISGNLQSAQRKKGDLNYLAFIEMF